MDLLNCETGEITKQYQRTEAEIQQIIFDYLWLTRPDPTQLDNLTSLIKRLRTELHDEFDNMGGVEL